MEDHTGGLLPEETYAELTALELKALTFGPLNWTDRNRLFELRDRLCRKEGLGAYAAGALGLNVNHRAYLPATDPGKDLICIHHLRRQYLQASKRLRHN